MAPNFTAEHVKHYKMVYCLLKKIYSQPLKKEVVSARPQRTTTLKNVYYICGKYHTATIGSER